MCGNAVMCPAFGTPSPQDKIRYMRIKRLLLCVLAGAFMTTLTVSAQTSSMTDEQVIQYYNRETAKGTPQQRIVTNLIERGVQIDQIRRIRQKMERQKGTDQLGTKDLTGQEKSRLRKSNSQQRAQDKDDPAFERRKQWEQKPDFSQMTEAEKLRYRQMQSDNYMEEMDFMKPDSLRFYDEYERIYAERMKKDKWPQVFGRNIFNQENLSFEPNMNIATPSDYRLGPGDEVFIDIWGASHKSMNSTVSPDGTIEVEDYGPVDVGGLSVAQANARLKATVGRRYQSSNIRLTVGQTKTIMVNVMGEVKTPGTYTLSAFATVFHALYAAGGTNDIGTLRSIKVFRNGRNITTVDVYDYILNGKLTGNVRLQNEDVIVVGPYEALVNVSGRVKRPMYYEMKKNESVSTLLKYAGGFTGDAYQENIRLFRKSGNLRSIYSLGEFDRGTFQVTDGDSLVVDSVLDRYRNMVEVRGAVFRPGMYQMDGSVGSVRQLIETAGGLREDAYVERAVMHRRRPDRTLEAISLDLDKLMAGELPDVALNNEDVLYVPSRKELQKELTLSIYGEVLYPGQYEYAENTTIGDLVLQAGGLKDAASLMKVDVSRRLRNNLATEANNEVTRTFTFSFKNGLEVDAQDDFKLEPFDEIFIRRSPGYVEQSHVEVEGEVAFEGKYTISNKGQRLSDLIKMAGGVNEGAYTKGAHLERLTTDVEKERQRALMRSKMVTKEDSLAYKQMEVDEYHTVGINLDKALENPGDDRWDVVLMDGDRLVVPRYNNTVSISGEVMNPSTVAYREKASLKDYINAAGGYSLKAKKGRVYAVNSNGTVTKVRSYKDIEPGCSIIVPAKENVKRISMTEIVGLGSLVASLLTAITLLVTK